MSPSSRSVSTSTAPGSTYTTATPNVSREIAASIAT
jgi:hypothetical protein